MIEIPLTHGYVAIIDDEDAELVSGRKWHARKNQRGKVYAARKRRYQAAELMHRLIARAPKGMQVDHIDGNPLNNRRSNLRLCTATQNAWNRRQPTVRSAFEKTGFRGLERSGNRWRVRITHYGKRVNVGSFRTPEEAAKAYDAKIIELRGEYAAPNYPKAVSNA